MLPRWLMHHYFLKAQKVTRIIKIERQINNLYKGHGQCLPRLLPLKVRTDDVRDKETFWPSWNNKEIPSFLCSIRPSRRYKPEHKFRIVVSSLFCIWRRRRLWHSVWAEKKKELAYYDKSSKRTAIRSQHYYYCFLKSLSLLFFCL